MLSPSHGSRPRTRVVGVLHTTQGRKGGPLNKTGQLKSEINRLAKEGTTRVGLEFVPARRPEKGDDITRYFYRAVHLMKRKGITPVEIDDPTALDLNNKLSYLMSAGVPWELTGWSKGILLEFRLSLE